jgi:hypothetical protein
MFQRDNYRITYICILRFVIPTLRRIVLYKTIKYGGEGK